MPLPRWLARFNRHGTNRLLSRFAPRLPGLGVVVHRGRRSGKAYRTPVNVFRARGRYVIALTYGPETEWTKNVLSAGGCELETRGKVVRLLNPQLLVDPRRRLVPAGVRAILGLLGVSHFLLLTPAGSQD